jgi:hypothetical protein
VSSQIDFSTYEAWLKKERYQASTRALSVRNLMTIANHPNKKIAPYLIPQAQRYIRFVTETKKNPMGVAFLARLKKQGIEASEAIKKAGKRSKTTLTPAKLAKIKAKLRGGSEVDRLILAYAFSGMRVAAFLHMPCSNMQEHPDKISRDWVAKAVDVSWNDPMYKLLCKTERCAYSRMRTRMREVAEQLKIDVDLDTLYLSRKEAGAESIAA